MAKRSEIRTVQCYHCGHRFDVSGMAESTSCPGCNKPLFVGDIDIKGQRGPIRELRTCGSITIGKKGRLICEFIEAHGGIDCVGIIDSKRVLSGGRVHLGPKTQFRGALIAPSVVIDDGCKITLSGFEVPASALDRDAEEQPRPRGGKVTHRAAT